jgi:glucokinase
MGNFPIRDFFKKTFLSAFVVVDNDVNIMALGEQRAGDGAGVDHFIFVKIGTGIGAGIISNGKIHRGSDGCAGDIGHICVDKEGPVYGCGNRGCLEAMAAGPAIASKAMGLKAVTQGLTTRIADLCENDLNRVTPKLIAQAAHEGDEIAKDIYERAGFILALPLQMFVWLWGLAELSWVEASHVQVIFSLSRSGVRCASVSR